MRHTKHIRISYARGLYHILWIMPQDWVTICCGFNVTTPQTSVLR